MKNLLFMFSFLMGMSAFAQEVKTLKSQEIFKISDSFQQPEYLEGSPVVL